MARAMILDEAMRCRAPIVMVLGGGYSRQALGVQYRSIRWIIGRYGLEPGGARHLPRRLTVKEKIYTK